MVQYNFSGKRPEDTLKDASFRFAAIFESAANYGLLNNMELGLIIQNNSYQFWGYDGVKWSEIPQQAWLSNHELPEGVEVTLTLDDLPIEEPLLFDSSTFTEQTNEYLSFDEIEAKKTELIIPQVYLLSGGEITPFSLTFHFSEQASLYGDLADLAYRVTGIYTIPLTIEGPTLNDK
jgi:general secretion pathway protein H